MSQPMPHWGWAVIACMGLLGLLLCALGWVDGWMRGRRHLLEERSYEHGRHRLGAPSSLPVAGRLELVPDPPFPLPTSFQEGAGAGVGQLAPWGPYRPEPVGPAERALMYPALVDQAIGEALAVANPDPLTDSAFTAGMAADMDVFLAGLLASHPAPAAWPDGRSAVQAFEEQQRGWMLPPRAVAQRTEHPSLKEVRAGSSPAGPASCELCGGDRWQTITAGRCWRCRNCGAVRETEPGAC
jgi:hypothetical protein